MRRPVGLGVLLALAAAAAPSQTQTPTPTSVPGFAERVEVNVRTIFAVVVDPKGRALGRPLGPGDIEVLEDGIPAQVLGVDPIRPVGAGSTPSAAAPASPPASTSTKPAPSGPIQTLPQFLYVDTSLMRKQSVKQVAETVEKNLEAILSRGLLEIVVADPDPKVFTTRTGDAAEIRRKLEELSRKVSGRERMLDIRRDLNPRIDANGSPLAVRSAGIQGQARARAGIHEEIALVRQALERLDRWAAANASGHPAIVYLAEDGFDANPGDFWANLLQGDGSMEQMAQGNLIRNEVAGEIPKLVAESSKTLAESGFTAVMLALGRLDAAFADDAASTGKRSGGQLRRPFDAPPPFTYVRPLEPLRIVADQTGGEVVTSAEAFAPALERLSGAVAITYRMDRPADGRPHRLEVRSRVAGVVLRTARSVVAGTSRMAAAVHAVDALAAPAAKGDLPLEATIDLFEVKKNDRRVGELRVSADLASIASALDRVGPGRVRVTIAVERGGFKPFVSAEEVDLAREGSGTTWLYNAPLEWPSDARRVSVRVEEQKTGTFGAATAELPSPGKAGDATAAQATPGGGRIPAITPRGPELECEATLSNVERRGSNQGAAMLRVVVALEPIFDRLVRGGGNARMTLRVFGDGAAGRVTIATFEKTVPLDITVDRWAFELPIRWPVSINHIVVSFVEVATEAHAERTLSPPPLSQ
ncbi:MAG: hypothetical protein M3167_17180 [Acidobacteriota bacterium]|nr:hypothetical protein [Acidobacteriota bacterium]